MHGEDEQGRKKRFVRRGPFPYPYEHARGRRNEAEPRVATFLLVCILVCGPCGSLLLSREDFCPAEIGHLRCLFRNVKLLRDRVDQLVASVGVVALEAWRNSMSFPIRVITTCPAPCNHRMYLSRPQWFASSSETNDYESREKRAIN